VARSSSRAQKIDRDALDHRTLDDLRIKSADDYHPDTMAIIGMVEVIDCVTKHPSRFFKEPLSRRLLRRILIVTSWSYSDS
jgi:hypothetical protein